MKGWIRLHRSLTDHWLWTGEPYTKAQAWIDILLHANYTDNEIMIKGQVVSLRRGQQARSELTLSKKWSWSRNKVRRFLKQLASHSMVEQHTTHLTSVITVCNYDNFQINDTPDDTPYGTSSDTPNGTTSDTADGHLTAHSKEIKKERKKESNNKSVNFTDDDMQTSQWMFDRIKSISPAHKEPNFEKWSNTIRLMREKDGIELSEICRVFDWCNKDSFEKSNVLCPDKLRSRFSALSIKSDRIESPKKQSFQERAAIAQKGFTDNTDIVDNNTIEGSFTLEQ